MHCNFSWLDFIRICSIMSLYDDRNDFPFRKVHKSRAFSDDSSLQNYYILLQKKEEILLGRKVDKSLLFCDIFGIILGQKTNNLEERRERDIQKMPLLTRSLEKKTFLSSCS